MAVYGITNIVETVRLHRMPYWKIYRTQTDRDAGNVIACADFENPNLGLEESAARLSEALRRQTPGKYIITAFKSPGQSKGGLSTDVEVEYTGINSATGIGAVNNNSSSFHMDGIGEVTPQNIGQVIEKKLAELKEKEKEENRVLQLEAENKRLTSELKEYDNGVNKGLLSIGSIVWNMMRGTDAGKEVIGMMSDFKKYSNNVGKNHAPGPSTGGSSNPKEQFEEAEVVEMSDEKAKQMTEALESLSKDNPDMIKQLQMLAKLKQDNPEMFKEAVDNLNVIVG